MKLKIARFLILVSVFCFVILGFGWLIDGEWKKSGQELWVSFWMLMYLHQREVFNLDGVRATNR